MTDDKIALQDLLEKSSDASLLREMIGVAPERIEWRMGIGANTSCNFVGLLRSISAV